MASESPPRNGNGVWLTGTARAIMQLGAAGVVCLLLIVSQINLQSTLASARADQQRHLELFVQKLDDLRTQDQEGRRMLYRILEANTEQLRLLNRQLEKKNGRCSLPLSQPCLWLAGHCF